MIERDHMNRLFGTTTGNDCVAVSHAGCRVCRTKPVLTFLHHRSCTAHGDMECCWWPSAKLDPAL